MTDKILWNTVRIRLPPEFVTVSKKGVVNIKPPLTKKNNISKTNQEPSIQFESGDTNEVSIVKQGLRIDPTRKRIRYVNNLRMGLTVSKNIREFKQQYFNLMCEEFKKELRKKKYHKSLEYIHSLVNDNTVSKDNFLEDAYDFKKVLEEDRDKAIK